VIFTELPLAGAFLIEPERHADERGFFARVWCAREFGDRGLATVFVQSSISFNKRRGTLRGLHLQSPPHAETKLVRCTRGAAFDVLVDLRPESATYKRWHVCELTAENRGTVYIPEGIAHGFQTLSDDTELAYCISTYYEPAAARGVRWDDPTLAIAWPMVPPTVVSEKDRQLPFLAI
jgi:dTDP-4-dehydrorhamnose 3,5-epimerase